MTAKKQKHREKDELPTYNSWTELPHIPVSEGVPGSIGKTGEWRAFRPVVNKELCSKCGLCYIYCPEGVISFVKGEFPEVDLVYCKGCGVCAHECPKKAIEMKIESEA